MLKRLSLIFAALAVIAGMLASAPRPRRHPERFWARRPESLIDEMYQCTLTTIGHDNRRPPGPASRRATAARRVGRGYPSPIRTRVWWQVRRVELRLRLRGDRVRSREGDSGEHYGQVHDHRYRQAGAVPGRRMQTGPYHRAHVRSRLRRRAAVAGDVDQLCVIEGDSGSPVVVGTTLVAMVNAYLGVACLGPELGTNMTAIIDNINATGGVGAGFRPI